MSAEQCLGKSNYFCHSVTKRNPKNFMKRTIIFTLLALGFSGHLVLAQEVRVDPELLRDIVRGHQLLSQYAECLSGKVEIFRESSSMEKPELSSSERSFLFFRDKKLLRLEYIHPMKDTEVFPGHEKNNITEVIMFSKDRNFQWRAIPSTGVPYANLFRSTGSNATLEITLSGDFYDNINALVAVSGSIDYTIVDLLQNEIGHVESRRYNEVHDAVWITSPKNTDTAGNTSSWTVVLNPKQHYALLFHEMRVENSKTAFLATSSKTIITQVSSDGKIFPKEIVFKGQGRALVDTQKQEVNTGNRALVSVFATDKPDEWLFSEESFKDMGRDYAVVDVLPNQKPADTGGLVMAAPLASRVPYYPVDEFSVSHWSWIRIVLMASGIVLIAIACLRMYFRWRHSKTHGND